jgi:MFS superfamily sulfate permease-like transporter
MKSIFQNFRADLPASIVVFFVALPLCLGIALASGAPLFSGIIAGIVGGIIVGSISASPLGVSGPAAGLAVIVLGYISTLGSFEAFLTAVVIAGVIQLLMGYLRLGTIAYYFPSAVIKGMLSGIGLIIILKQIPHAVGYDSDFEGNFNFAQSDGENSFSELSEMLNYINPEAFFVALISITILIFWEKVLMKKNKIFKLLQGPLVVVVLGIILSNFLPFRQNQLVSIPVSKSFSEFFSQFTFPDFSQLKNPQIYLMALVIAVIASLETLLCVEATDKIDPQKRITPTNRELKAQGFGNIICGLIGGLPVTQVIVRSSANISFGGKTKLSTILHGFFLLISAITIPILLNMIPLASLAAILLVVGYKLASPANFRKIHKLGNDQFIPFIATIIGMIFFDLLKGVMLGMAISIGYILYNNFRNSYQRIEDNENKGNYHIIRLAEEVSFLNKGSILKMLSEIPHNSKVVIDATNSHIIDYDIIEIIADFRISAKSKKIELTIKGINFNS